MATFIYTPDYGATANNRPRVRAVRFSDGYEQRLSYGINNNPQDWSVSFSMRDNDEAAAIEAFFAARNASESFDWTPPNGSAGKYVCREWSKSVDRYNLNSITAKFEQVYDL